MKKPNSKANDFGALQNRFKKNTKPSKAPNDFNPPMKFKKPDVAAIQRRLRKTGEA